MPAPTTPTLQDFMNLDNPILTQMIDYDAVSACLRAIPLFKSFKGEQMEQLLDRWVGGLGCESVSCPLLMTDSLWSVTGTTTRLCTLNN
jgi:hypothetical protein